MANHVTRAFIALTMVATSMASADVEIPVVPASVMQEDVPEPVTRSSEPPKRESNPNVTTSPHLVMTPGVNEIVPVAIGHLNRIVTPFGEPQVTTTSSATTEVRDNVVYVATDKEVPVTLFITQKDSEARALSLTLLPQRIPPRELFVELEGGSIMPGMVTNPKAEAWETSQPYVDTLRSVLRKVALGEMPQGYTLHKIETQHPTPSCLQPGMHFSFSNGQMLVGHNLTVNVGVAENVSGQPVEIREASCGDWNVAAVAAWPQNVLAPGERTEIYVVTKQGQRKAPTTQRPSLLGGER